MTPPPLVLLHAFPLDARMWESQIAVLEQAGYEVLAPNLPGREPEVTVARWAERVLELLPGDFIPVGISAGGYLVFELWRQASARIPAAVLADTRATPDTPEGRDARDNAIRVLGEDGFEAFWEELAPKLFGPAAEAEVKEHAHGIASEQPITGLVASLETLRDRPDSRETAAAMSVPVLVVVGEEDVLTPPSDAEALVASLPQARLVRIQSAGHLTPVEKPDEFNEELLVFLAEAAPLTSPR